MRASELIGCDVYDTDGERVGAVHDLRFDMSWTSEHRLVCELTGIQCHPGPALGHRLGYGTGDMAGPWPVSVLFRFSRRRFVDIGWGDVARISPSRIELHRSRAEIVHDGSKRP